MSADGLDISNCLAQISGINGVIHQTSIHFW